MTTQYFVRTVKKDMTSHGGFVWPASGPVEAPDWRDDDKCGGGLHGFLNGHGNGQLCDNSEDAVWLLCSTDAKVVDLGGKIKCERANVIMAGDRDDVLAALDERVGDLSIGRMWGSVSAGEYDSACAGDYGSASAGDCGSAAAGANGSAAAGWHGSASSGELGSASAGNFGSAAAGRHGSASAGEHGVCVSSSGRVRVGNGGVAVLAYMEKNGDLNAHVLRPGENGIKADTWYGLDDDNNLVEIDDE